MTRAKTREVIIGKGCKMVTIGGNSPIAIQSMCNTKTSDVASTVFQIKALEKLGCNIVRVAVLNMEDAKAIKEIVSKIDIPLVADIHFDYKLALASIEAGVDKLRINPGNIGSIENVEKVVNACKVHNIPIRIGVNLGSLNKSIEVKYGRTAKALYESAKEHIEILERLDFHNIVVSVKASDINTCIEAYKMLSESYDYPLHIGITEAGSAYSGLVKSSIGLGILLNEGIGDTIRVSLSTDPIEEIKAAKEILSNFNYYTKPLITACPTCGRTKYDMLPLLSKVEDYVNTTYPNTKIHIAIMGCAVNGPGEARDADIGIAGGINEALLFKKGEIVRKIKEENLLKEFLEEIDKFIKENNL